MTRPSYSGVIVGTKLGNPHGELSLDVGGTTWVVEVGQPWRNQRAGLKDEMLVKGVKITASGHRHVDPKKKVFKAERIFIDVESTVTGWASDDRVGLHVVPTTGVPLIPAAPGSVGNSGDWLNEIHPNKSGWGKLAQAWQKELDAIL